MNPRRLLYMNTPLKVGFNPKEGEYDVVDVSWDWITNHRGLGYSLEPLRKAKVVVVDNSKLANIVLRHTNRPPVIAHFGECGEITVQDTPAFSVGFLCHSQTAFNNLRSNKLIVDRLAEKHNGLVYVDEGMGEVKLGYETTNRIDIFASKVDILCLLSPANSVNDLALPLALMKARCAVIASSDSNYRELGSHEGYHLLPNHVDEWLKQVRQSRSVKAFMDSEKEAAVRLSTRFSTQGRAKLESILSRHMPTRG